jgi:putative Holliday junction resolvase
MTSTDESSPIPPSPPEPATESVEPVVVFPEVPRHGRLLGIDYGDKRIGFAISTPEQTISSAIENYTRRTSALDIKQIRHWCEEYVVKGIVIGLPIHMNGHESQKSTQCRRFAAWVYEHIKLPIALHDERCTTAVVIDHLIELDLSRKQRKKKLDMLAAQVLLESYLNSRQPMHGSDDDTETEVETTEEE